MEWRLAFPLRSGRAQILLPRPVLICRRWGLHLPLTKTLSSLCAHIAALATVLARGCDEGASNLSDARELMPMVPFRVITNAVFRVAAAWCRNPRQGRLSGTLLPLGLWRSNGASGPLLPFTATSRCCGAARRSGHSCIVQHFLRVKRRPAD
jgi:hypothetical protein